VMYMDTVDAWENDYRTIPASATARSGKSSLKQLSRSKTPLSFSAAAADDDDDVI